MAQKKVCRSVRLPSSFIRAIIVFAARADPRLTTNVDAETAGRWENDIKGFAR